jgi:preprotein translocase subunit SecA
MFEQMVAAIREDTARGVLMVQLRTNEEPKRQQVAKITGTSGGDGSDKKQPKRNAASDKVGRNDPCPCGSGKKYKKCCGR